MRHLLAWSIACVVGSTSLGAATAERSESLGSGLLDGLAPELLEPPPAPRDQPAGRAPREQAPGSDLGAESGRLPLARVRQDMQQAETLLGGPQAIADAAALEQAGAIQQRVVAQLDELIDELAKQCQGGQCQTSDEQPASDDPAEAATDDGQPATAAGHSAAADSDARLDGATTQQAERAELESLIHSLWGHLPERAREQMLQSFSDEFLPKYELEIEEYYRRLSEDADDRRSP